jgi:DNA-binding transcriptional LysR family regulator
MHASVLRYFVEVARSGSIRKAAQHLFVASSAVNRQILQLEGELGCELFDRLPGGMRLNAAGRLVLQHAQSTLNDFQLLRTDLDALRGERTGHIDLVAMDSLFTRILPDAVAEFAHDYPAVTFTLLAMPPADIPAAVVDGKADIGIAFMDQKPPGLDVAFTAKFPIGVLMAPDHPLARRYELSYADLRGQPFLLAHSRWPLYSTMAPAFAEFWDSLSPVMVSNVSPVIKQAVLAGRGLSFFTKLGFLDEVADGRAVWRPLADPAINRMKLALATRRNHKLSLVQKAFIAVLEAHLRRAESS